MTKRRLLPTLLILVVLLWATYLRVVHFSDWPPGLSNDEAINGLDAVRFLQTGVMPLYMKDGRPEPLYRLVQVLTILVAGPTRFGARLASLYIGVLTVAAAYRAGRHFVPRGHESRARLGLIAAAVVAVMIGHIHLSRVAYRAILQPFAMLMFIDAFVSAWDTRHRRGFAAAGLWLGVCLMSYTAAAIMIPVMLVGFGQRFIIWASDLPQSIRRGPNISGVLTFLVVSVIAVIPLLILMNIQPDFYGRAEEVGGVSIQERLSDPAAFVERLEQTWRMVRGRGDINPQYNVDHQPLIGKGVLYWLLWAGVAAILLHPRRMIGWMALSSMVLALLPAALARELPHGLRIVGEYAALPLVITASALLPISLSERLKRVRWSGYVLRAVYAVGISAVLLFTAYQSLYTYAAYFQSDVRWGTGGVISAFTWFFETRYETMAEVIAESDGPVYVPLSAATQEAFRYFTIASHPEVTTYADFVASDGSLRLNSGTFLMPPGETTSATYVMFLPDGRVVLLPRLPDQTLAQLQAAVAEEGTRVLDPYGELAATSVTFPQVGEVIRIQEPVAHQIGAVNFDNQALMIGWDASLELPADGGETYVTVYFRPGTDNRRDVRIFMQLWDIGGERLASGPEELLHRWLFPPDQWGPDDVIPAEMRVPVPEGLEPGAYHIAVGLRDYLNQNLPVIGADGQPVGDAAVAAALKVPRTSVVDTEGIVPVTATLSDEFELLGYTLADAATGETVEAVMPGESLVVTLYWEALRLPRDNYTVFVHMVNANEELVAQNDSQPEGGRYPTGIWGPGEIVATTHLLIVPEDAVEPFTLYAGMYSWPSLERVPVFQDGRVVDERRALLGMVD